MKEKKYFAPCCNCGTFIFTDSLKDIWAFKCTKCTFLTLAFSFRLTRLLRNPSSRWFG